MIDGTQIQVEAYYQRQPIKRQNDVRSCMLLLN